MINEQLQEKTEKERKEKRKEDLEKLKQGQEKKPKELFTYLQYITGDSEQKKEEELLSSLVEIDKDKEGEEKELQKRLEIRKLLVESGLQSSAWKEKTSYKFLSYLPIHLIYLSILLVD